MKTIHFRFTVKLTDKMFEETIADPARVAGLTNEQYMTKKLTETNGGADGKVEVESVIVR